MVTTNSASAFLSLSELRSDIEKAENNLRVNPNDYYHTALECRRFAERLSKAIGMRASPQVTDENDNLDAFVTLLQSKGLISGWVVTHLTDVRRAGKSVHISRRIYRQRAVDCIQKCKELASWFEDGSEKPTAITPEKPKPIAEVHVLYPDSDVEDEKSKNDPIQIGQWIGLVGLAAAVALLIALIPWSQLVSKPPSLVTGTPEIASGETAYPSVQTFTVEPLRGDTLNLRAGPGIEFDPPIRALQRGDIVRGIGEKRGRDGALWILIADNAGTRLGYAKVTGLHKLSPPSSTIPAEQPTLLSPPTPVPPSRPLPPEFETMLSQASALIREGNLKEAYFVVKQADALAGGDVVKIYKVKLLQIRLAEPLHDSSLLNDAYDEAISAAGAAAPEAEGDLVQRAMQAAFDQKNYTRTIQLADRAKGRYQFDDAHSLILIHAYFLTGDFRNARDRARTFVDTAEASSTSPPFEALAILLNSEQALQPNGSAAVAAVRRLCRYFPADKTCRLSRY